MNEQIGVPRTFKGIEPRPLVFEASPKSTGHYAGLHPEDRPYQTRQRLPPTPPHYDDDAVDTERLTRGPTSVRRYDQPTTRIRVQHHSTIPQRRTIPQQTASRRTTDQAAPASHPQGYHWLVYAGLAILVAVIGYSLITVIGSWLQVKHDDLTYGYPRTYQTDAVVGHNDSPAHPSHFIALNLRGHVLVIEVEGGDSTKVRAITGPDDVSPTGNLDPVTLTFKDVNGDGKPDMIVTIGDTNYVYLNDQGTFRPVKPGENVTL